MKKAMFLVLAAALVFACVAPAFAETMVENQFGDGQKPNIWIPMQAQIKVLQVLDVTTSDINLQFGDVAPDATKTGGVTVTVKSNAAFHKGFKFLASGGSYNFPGVADPVLNAATATLTQGSTTIAYALGTQINRRPP